MMTEMNSVQSSFDYQFRYIMIGDAGVGKTSLLNQFTRKKFFKDQETTVGVEFGSCMRRINDMDIKIYIWDTAGQECYRSLTRSYYRKSAASLLVYDITKRESFQNANKWLLEVRQDGNKDMTIVLLGNKSDITGSREVSFEEGDSFAKEYNLIFFEISAKTGQNLEAVFVDSAKEILQKISDGVVISSRDAGIVVGQQSNKKDSGIKDLLIHERSSKSCCFV